MIEFLKLWLWMKFQIKGEYRAKLQREKSLWRVYRYEGWGVATFWGWGKTRLEALRYAKLRYDCLSKGGSLIDLYKDKPPRKREKRSRNDIPQGFS